MNLQSVVAKKEKELCDIKAKIKDLESDIDSSNKMLDDREKSLNQLRGEVSKLKSQVDEANLKVWIDGFFSSRVV